MIGKATVLVKKLNVIQPLQLSGLVETPQGSANALPDNLGLALPAPPQL